MLPSIRSAEPWPRCRRGTRGRPRPGRRWGRAVGDEDVGLAGAEAGGVTEGRVVGVRRAAVERDHAVAALRVGGGAGGELRRPRRSAPACRVCSSAHWISRAPNSLLWACDSIRRLPALERSTTMRFEFTRAMNACHGSRDSRAQTVSSVLVAVERLLELTLGVVEPELDEVAIEVRAGAVAAVADVEARVAGGHPLAERVGGGRAFAGHVVVDDAHDRVDLAALAGRRRVAERVLLDVEGAGGGAGERPAGGGEQLGGAAGVDRVAAPLERGPRSRPAMSLIGWRSAVDSMKPMPKVTSSTPSVKSSAERSAWPPPAAGRSAARRRSWTSVADICRHWVPPNASVSPWSVPRPRMPSTVTS